MPYLTDIPQDIENFGFCKVLAVRKEVIHIKHIFTEIFIYKTIDITSYLDNIDWSLFKYFEYMTNRLRKIHHFSRNYCNDINEIVKNNGDGFFPTIDLYSGLNNLIILDFDGVVTDKRFKSLYDMCLDKNKTVISSANPTITETWFNKRWYGLPNEIYSNKGKIKKIRNIIELSKKYDHVFYVDNEEEYLKYAWLFGIKTFLYTNGKIKYFTMKTK